MSSSLIFWEALDCREDAEMTANLDLLSPCLLVSIRQHFKEKVLPWYTARLSAQWTSHIHAAEMSSVDKGYFNRLRRLLITPKHFTTGSPSCLPQHKSSAIPGIFDHSDCSHVKLQNADLLKVTRREKYTNGSSYQPFVISGLLFRRVYKIIDLPREQPNVV